MKIAVIGTGRVGTSLGNSLAQAGYEIAGLADADPAAWRQRIRALGVGSHSTG